MTRPKVCIGITCVGGTLVPATLQMLRQSALVEYRIIGLNSTPAPVAAAFLDGFHAVPRGDDPSYAATLLEIVRQEKIDILLPWSDDEAEAVSAMTGLLRQEGCRPLVSSPECLARISNKRITYDLLRAAGLPSPEYTAVHDVAALRTAITGYGFPDRTVVVKPSRGRGGRGLQILLGRDNPPDWLGSGQRESRWDGGLPPEDALAAFFAHGGELLVMPCLGVPAYDADVLVMGGDPLVVVRRRHNPTGIPFQGNTLVADPDVSAYCRAVADALGLEGLHDIDLMTGPDGRPLVLEVNPRPSGSMAASLAAGFPLIDWAVCRSLGHPVAAGVPAADLQVLPMLMPHVVQG